MYVLCLNLNGRTAMAYHGSDFDKVLDLFSDRRFGGV